MNSDIHQLPNLTIEIKSPTVYCSFCEKSSKDDDGKFIRAKFAVICGDCVEVCIEVLRKDTTD